MAPKLWFAQEPPRPNQLPSTTLRVVSLPI